VSSASALDCIGVGIDTARYGHRVAFLRPDRSPAAPPLTVMENRAGYQALEDRLRKLHSQHPSARIQIHLDAAGQYAVNLEQFLRGLDLPMTLSIGEPKRNKDYRKAHFPKRTTDDTESQAMARFAVVERPQATPSTSAELLLLREIAGRLQAQVKQTTQAVNRLHNLLARTFPELDTLIQDVATGWVLQLLDKYPSAERIGRAHLDSLSKIPYFPPDKAEAIQRAARESVATLSGDGAEALIRSHVSQVRQSQDAEKHLKHLLSNTFAELTETGHRQLVTIPGIGPATAAVLVAKIGDIRRFETADQVVGYFGIFPEEDRSGVDRRGRPLPAGTMHMCHKGNDLVRGYLWNAARVAIRHNPAIRALYRRLRSRGKRGDVALGHCMRKLLHLVFAVWTTDLPFNADHYPWENPDSAQPVAVAATDAVAADDETKTAVGHKQDVPAEKVVTTTTSSVPPVSVPINPPARSRRTKRPMVDYEYLRQQITMAQVLRHLGLQDQLHGRGQQLRGPCPVHSQPTEPSQTFSVHLGKNIFRCFKADCGIQGNVLDLWAAVHKQPLYEAALHLAETFGLRRNREEEPVNTAVDPEQGRTQKRGQ
jgi:transposase